MINGVVTREREVIVSLTLRGPTGVEIDIEAVIDTGFSDMMMVTPAIVSCLSLEAVAPTEVQLGDGSMARMTYYRAQLDWLAGPRDILVLESEGGVMIGMALLFGSDLFIQAREGGRATIGPSE